MNALDGKIVEQAYVGVATQYIVDTDCGRLTVYRQNASPGLNGAASGQPTHAQLESGLPPSSSTQWRDPNDRSS